MRLCAHVQGTKNQGAVNALSLIGFERRVIWRQDNYSPLDRYGHLFPAGDDERTKVEKAASFLTEVASASMKPKSTLRATIV